MRQKWEYEMVTAISAAAITSLLKGQVAGAGLGAQGWELVAVVQNESNGSFHAFFKRPVDTPSL